MKLTDWLTRQGYGFDHDAAQGEITLTGEWISESTAVLFSDDATIVQAQDAGCDAQDKVWIITDSSAHDTYRLYEFMNDSGPNGEITQEPVTHA